MVLSRLIYLLSSRFGSFAFSGKMGNIADEANALIIENSFTGVE